MKTCRMFVAICLLVLLNLSFKKKADPYFEFHENLSDYRFFLGPMKELKPADGIIPYDLITPLFSNYAEKLRFIKLPAGSKAGYNDSAVFDMPKGTVLIKNFYYPNDFRHPGKGRKIIETRLLVHQEKGWTPFQYIWNEEQTEAVFEPVGDAITVSYVDSKGKKVTAPYIIPSQPQCKGCHAQGNILFPIGLAARHLNTDYDYGAGKQNQLSYWQNHSMLDLPTGHSIPANVNWQNKKAGTEARARAYLDINCGFCHSRKGPANKSGLFLDIYTPHSTALGILKPPVAAGRGSGNLEYDIVPGQPNKSILLYRMTSTDPGISMPEIGREQVHKEAVALLSEWIKNMKK